jgi:hypothetical protein
MLTLLVINTVSVLTLNLLYDSESLRPRFHWRGVSVRNAILGVLFLGLYLFARTTAQTGTESRPSAIKSRILRIVAWTLLTVISVVEATTLASNLLFHQSVTLVRTPAQTYSLIHSVLFGLLGTTLLVRHRLAKTSGGLLPADLRSMIIGALWHGIKKSVAYSVVYALVFCIGAFAVYQWSIAGNDPQPFFLGFHFPAFAAIYVLAGLLCGAHAGAVAAVRDKTEILVKHCDSLAAPLMHSIVMSIPLDSPAGQSSLRQSFEELKLSAGTTFGGLLGKFVRNKFAESLRGAWVVDLIEQSGRQNNESTARGSLATALRERMVRLATDDINRRARLVQWAIYAIAGLIFISPAMFIILR